MVMCGNYPQFDISPEASYFKLSLKNTQEFRGISWSLKPFWVTDIAYRIDVGSGDVETTITAIPETMQDPFVPAYSQYDDLGKQTNPAPAGGAFAYRKLMGQVDRPDVKVLPAVIVGPAETEGQAVIQLFGDPAYEVIASNRLMKAIPDRAVVVEVRMNDERTGRPGAAQYEIVNLGQYYGEGEQEYEIGYTTRVAVLCVGGKLKMKEDVAFPLTVMGSALQVQEMFARVKSSSTEEEEEEEEGEGAGATIEVVVNSTVLATFACGVDGGRTDQGKGTMLHEMDAIRVNVTAVSGGAKDLIVEIECKEFGL